MGVAEALAACSVGFGVLVAAGLLVGVAVAEAAFVGVTSSLSVGVGSLVGVTSTVGVARGVMNITRLLPSGTALMIFLLWLKYSTPPMMATMATKPMTKSAILPR